MAVFSNESYQHCLEITDNIEILLQFDTFIRLQQIRYVFLLIIYAFSGGKMSNICKNVIWFLGKTSKLARMVYFDSMNVHANRKYIYTPL